MLQADQNADFFVVDRRDFPANETSDILPGQTIILTSGGCAIYHCRPCALSDNCNHHIAKALPPSSSALACTVPGGPKTLDFAGVTRLLNIMGNGTLEVKGLNIRGMASRHLLGTAVIPNLRAVGFALWPTITAQPNAKVLY